MKRNVRAKDIPKIVFDKIVEDTGSETFPVKMQDGYFDAIFIKDAQAIVACVNDVHTSRGIFSSLVIWFYAFGEDFKPEDCTVWGENPFFQLRAGPFYSGKDDPDRGHELVENVFGDFNPKNSSECGIWPLNSVFIRFFIDVLCLSVATLDKYKFEGMSYWERIFAPQYNPHVDIEKEHVDVDYPVNGNSPKKDASPKDLPPADPPKEDTRPESP